MSILFEAVEPLSGVIHLFNKNDQDSSDRLNHKYSTIIFVILGIVVITNQYVGEIIKCWSPAEFPDHWVQYTEQVCWISNTYYIPMGEINILDSPKREIVYYQWVSLVLLLQAIMFFIPSLFWSHLNRSVGMSINKVVKIWRDIEHLNPESRDKTVQYLVQHMDRALEYTREINHGACSRFKSKIAKLGCFCGKRYGNFLMVIYLFTKLIYIGNICVQLYLMNQFLGTDYIVFGYEVIMDIAANGTYKESKRFPRVTLCDFEVRAVGKNIPHTVQCALPVNIFNEKIFIFVWFWLAIVGIISVLSFASWLWIAFSTNRRSYIRKYLKVFKLYNRGEDQQRLALFCDRYLRQDGHFALRMIGKNTSEVVVGETVAALWEYFRKKYPCHEKAFV